MKEDYNLANNGLVVEASHFHETGHHITLRVLQNASPAEAQESHTDRDNAPVLADITSEDDIENETQARAFEMIGCGGIKCAQIAGAIFNNKLDKKGHHDVFRWWWHEQVKCSFTFPDTSNTQFGSYCDAAIAFIVHLEDFKKFLVFIKEKKDKHRWSHMEENLWKALHDPPTLCELVILGL